MASLVEVSNESSLDLNLEAVQEFAFAALGRESGNGEVAVAFVDEPVMAELNERYRSLAEPTDVLSFSYAGFDDEDWPEPEESAPVPYLGDVVICPAVAAVNAAEDGIRLDLELRRLIIHGILHLLGYDHEADEGQMRAREEALLEEVAHTVPQSLVGGSTSEGRPMEGDV